MRRSTSPRRCSRAARDRLEAERDPLVDDLLQVLRARPAVAAEHHQVDRQAGFEARVGEQQVHELLRVLPARLAARARCAPASSCRTRRARCRARRASAFLRLICSCVSDFLPSLGFGIGRALDVLQHRARRHAERQLGDGDPPLAARELLDRPARAHAQAAAAALVDRADRPPASEMICPPPGRSGPGMNVEQLVER